MEIIYLLIPVSLIVVGIIIAAFVWAVRSGQFDDLEGPAHQILMDDDDPVLERQGQPDTGKEAAVTDDTEPAATPRPTRTRSDRSRNYPA